ncbi:MAG TPA: hypothetical protein VN622_11880 [Clostridia bacterium]|nr:hypothetical protein [Clostridia bacterium]
MADYYSELSQATGLPHYPKQGPFQTKEGAVIGVRGGYVTAAAPTLVNNQNAVSLFLRFKKVEDSTLVTAAIENSAQVLEALGEKKWSSGLKKQLTVGADFLYFRWNYSFRKHSADKVAELQSAICEAIKSVASPLETRCDMCASTACSELMLYNGVPGYYCASCQSQAQYQQQTVSQEYDAKETNLPRGVLFGVAAALAGSVAWGGVAYAIERIFLWGAVGIGWIVAKAVFAGIGKINRTGQALVLALTVASVVFGDVIFFTLSVMKSEGLAFSTGIVWAIVKNLVEIEKEGGNGLFTIGFALFGACYVLYTQGRKPKFVAVFEQLGTPAGEQSKAQGVSSGM